MRRTAATRQGGIGKWEKTHERWDVNAGVTAAVLLLMFSAVTRPEPMPPGTGYREHWGERGGSRKRKLSGCRVVEGGEGALAWCLIDGAITQA